VGSDWATFNQHFKTVFFCESTWKQTVGLGRDWILRARVGLGFLLQAQAFSGLGAYVPSKIRLGIWVTHEVLAHNPGPVGLGLLVYLVKTRARARTSGSGLRYTTLVFKRIIRSVPADQKKIGNFNRRVIIRMQEANFMTSFVFQKNLRFHYFLFSHCSTTEIAVGFARCNHFMNGAGLKTLLDVTFIASGVLHTSIRQTDNSSTYHFHLMLATTLF
jgi:hypothetical protein